VAGNDKPASRREVRERASMPQNLVYVRSMATRPTDGLPLLLVRKLQSATREVEIDHVKTPGNGHEKEMDEEKLSSLKGEEVKNLCISK
jgi:hypothetical protein